MNWLRKRFLFSSETWDIPKKKKSYSVYCLVKGEQRVTFIFLENSTSVENNSQHGFYQVND